MRPELGCASAALLGAAALVPARPAPAGLIEFTDKSEWFEAAGDVTTVDFTGYPSGTRLDEQYAHLGVLFPDVDDSIFVSGIFRNDGAGADGGWINGEFNVTFAAPIRWLATDFLVSAEYDLYRDGEMIATSDEFNDASGYGFGGVFSEVPFDAAVIRRGARANIDDLHFERIVPAPGALAAALAGLGIAGARGRRRRRAPARGGG